LQKRITLAVSFGSIPFSEQKFDVLLGKVLDKKAIGLVAKIGNEIVGFSYASIGEYFIGEKDKVATVMVLYTSKRIKRTLVRGKVFFKLFKTLEQIAKKENVKYLLTHVTSGVNIKSTDKFFRKIGGKTLGGNYLFKL
jgi:hypothetical protein